MTAPTFLQRLHRTPVMAHVLAWLAAPMAWWAELVAMQRSRHIHTELDDVLTQEYAVRQRIKSLEVVRYLHTTEDVRLQAAERMVQNERQLMQLQLRRLALVEEIRCLNSHTGRAR